MNKAEQQKIIKQQTKWPAVVAMIGAFLMVLCIFLPYSTATEERAEWIDKYPDTVVFEEMNVTAADMRNISMLQYTRMYYTMSEALWHDSTVGVFYIVMVAIIGCAALGAALFAMGRKPIGCVIIGAVSYGAVHIMNLDFTQRGVIPSSSYDWGMAHTLFPVAAVILAAGAIWMLAKKIIAKKQFGTVASVEEPAAE